MGDEGEVEIENATNNSEMNRIEKMFQLINNNMGKMNNKLDEITKEMRQLKQENNELKNKLIFHEDKIEQLEREIRKKNIVVKGIPDEEEENEEKGREKINTVILKMGVEIDEKIEVDEIRRIGKYDSNRTRPILVKFTKESTKMKILRSARKLKGTDIWVDEDYPKNIQEERRELIQKMKEARNKGETAILRYNKLIINNEIYKKQRKVEQEQTPGVKRTVGERSPDGDSLQEQLRKITKTNIVKKN